MEKVYYLVEDFISSLDYSKAKVVSLTPWASYELERRGISYQILEDYYSTGELLKGQDEFVREEMKCQEKLDEFLRESILFCREIDAYPARTHRSRLTYLTNTVIIQAYIVSEFIKKTSPERIVYVCKSNPRQTDFSVYGFGDKALRNILKVLEIFCKKKGNITLEVKCSGENKIERQGRDAPGSVLKETFKGALKNGYHLFKYDKLLKYANSDKGLKKTRILFLNAGGSRMDFLAKKFIQNGADLFIKDGDNIFQASSLSGRRVNWPKNHILQERHIKEDCLKASKEIGDKTNLYEWINSKAGIAVTSIVAPYIEDFVSGTCYNFLCETRNILELVRKEKIDFVISNTSVGENVAAPLAAGKALSGVKNLCFQHGSTVLDLKERFVFEELDAFDYYFASDSLSEKYFGEYSHAGGIEECRVKQSPHYLKDIISRQKKRKIEKKKREKVVYVTKKLAHGRMRFKSDGIMIFPPAYYYEYLKKLVDFFGKRRDFDFIYKHTPAQKWAEDSIIKYIKEKNYPNVFVEDKHFTHYLKTADRVILDYPSTGFFEAAQFGVPVMSLYSRLSEVWGPFKEHFGKSLKEFSTLDEAIARINEFLDDDPAEYVKEVPFSSGDISRLLKEIKS